MHIYSLKYGSESFTVIFEIIWIVFIFLILSISKIKSVVSEDKQGTIGCDLKPWDITKQVSLTNIQSLQLMFMYKSDYFNDPYKSFKSKRIYYD